ncbi:MAG: DnaJ domain-containing protein [Actinomycetota bacterium]|nr:DnaJ domain-containing protein [Actinomycetota bacterium]
MRAARGSTKVKVVTRRRLGRLVAIQLREERKRPTFGGSERGAEAADDEKPAQLPPAGEPLAEETEGPVTDETEGTAGTAAVAVEEVCTGLGAAGAGVGSLAVGGGRAAGRVGAVTVGRGSGTGGTGTASARACSASRPEPTRAIVAAATLIPGQLISARNGCGVCLMRENPDVAAVKRDYYEVLGLPRDADSDTIKRAFHALARDWHPDVAASPDAESRFRELAEAYSVLSKRPARLLYDRYGYRGRGNQGFDEALWEARPAVAARGENVHVGIELKSFEAAVGTRRIVSYEALVRCKACMGRGSVGLPDPECEYCGGTGRKRMVSSLEVATLLQIEPCPECIGESCSQCDGEGTVSAEHRIRLLVPPGVEDGAQLRVGGDGNDAGAGSMPGDLLVGVKVLAPPRNSRFIRYAALVLLVAAIATLALYVSR